jgi:hypothetical protein
MNKLLRILALTVLLAPSWAFTLTIEETSTFAKYPQLHDEIHNYWTRFRGAKVTDIKSGAHIAAMILLSEAEQDLLDGGFSPADLDTLRSEVLQVYATEQAEARRLANHNQLIHLAETYDTLTDKEADDQLLETLKDRPDDLLIYNNIKEQLAAEGLSTNSGHSSFKVGTNYLVLAMLEMDGFDFATDAGNDVIAPFLRNLNQYLENTKGSTPPTSEADQVISHRMSDASQRILSKWKKMHPHRIALVESSKQVWKKLSNIFWFKRGISIGWWPALTLGAFSFIDSVQTVHYRLSRELWFADAAYICIWVYLYHSELQAFRAANPMTDLNDRRYLGIEMIQTCENLLTQAGVKSKGAI